MTKREGGRALRHVLRFKREGRSLVEEMLNDEVVNCLSRDAVMVASEVNL